MKFDKETVIKRLNSLSYFPGDSDNWLITFAMEKVMQKIQNECNISLIPEGLTNVAVDMTCGEILFVLKQSGKLNDSFDLDVAIKQVQTGDTNVTFAIGDGTESVEQRLNSLINHLTTKGDGDFVCYRRIKW